MRTSRSLVAAGYADYPLLAYHFSQAATISLTWIPGLYALAMGVDALAALVFGRFFDRFGGGDRLDADQRATDLGPPHRIE
jgi:hypothetical protein